MRVRKVSDINKEAAWARSLFSETLSKMLKLEKENA